MNTARSSPDASPRDAAIRHALHVGWWTVMTLLPLGHLTGLRNTVTVIVVVATLGWAKEACWNGLPARWWGLATLAWCAASIGWSVVPGISFGKWRTDLLLPLMAYAAAFGYVKRTHRMTAIIGGTLSGIACLAVVSLPALLPTEVAERLANRVASETFATIVNPMPIWFPGVGDASMAVALAVIGAMLTPWPAVSSSRRRSTIRATASVSLVVLILFAINNRNATLAIPVVALLTIWLARRRSTTLPAHRTAPVRRRRLLQVLVVTVVLLGSLALVEIGARHRLLQMGTTVHDDESGLMVLTRRDTRPMIWRYYTRLALHSPWIGVGFGRTVPGITYHTESDRSLALLEGNAYTHAHDLLLDWWLQTGVVGVGLLLGTLGTLVITAWRARDATGFRWRPSAVTVMALVVMMLARNVTDDFLIFGMASLFWILVGAHAARLRTTDRRDGSS